MAIRTRLGRRIGVFAVATTVLAGCGSTAGTANTADRAFLAQMIPHHERAIAVARLGTTSAADPRVRAFAARIVREQTPELDRMRADAHGLGLDLVAGARAARDRITDSEVASLRSLHGAAYDRRFLQLHIASETGAAQMAEPEVRDGAVSDAVDVARGIATAPHTQIPELRSLLHAIGG